MGKTPPTVYLFIALTILFTVIGQLLVKWGVQDLGGSPRSFGQLPSYAIQAFTNPKIIAGLLAAVIAALTWTMALSHSNLSFAYPFMGLAIVLVLAISPMIFGEPLSWIRWIGVLVVCLGLWITARS